MWLSFTALELFPSTHAGMLTITWNHPLPLSHITAYRYTCIVRSNNNKSSLKRPVLDQKPLQCASNERESLWETPHGSYLQQGYWRDERTLPPGVKRCSRVRGWHPARISKQGSERLWNPLTSLVEPNQLFHLCLFNGVEWHSVGGLKGVEDSSIVQATGSCRLSRDTLKGLFAVSLLSEFLRDRKHLSFSTSSPGL